MVGIENANAKIETEKCSDVLQLSSGLSQDAAEWSQNSKNSKDSNADLTASHAKTNGHVESNDTRSIASAR